MTHERRLRALVRMCIEAIGWEDPDVVAFKREVEVEDKGDDAIDDVTRKAAELQVRDSNAKMNRSLASMKPISPTISAGGPKSGRRPDGGRTMSRKH